VEAHDLRNFEINNTGTAAIAETYYLYASKRADGGAIGDAIASAPGAAAVDFTVTPGTVSVPRDGYVTLTVKGDIALVDGTTVSNGNTAIITVATTAGDIDTVGSQSGQDTDPTVGSALTPNTHLVYKAYPVFALSATGQPSTTLVQKETDLLAVYDVTAVGNDDVTFATGQSNTLTLSWSVSETSASSSVDDLFYLKKDSGATTVASPAAVDINASSTVVFTFEDATFTVPAGATKKLYVYGDTTDLDSDGDTIQVFFDDVTTHISFSVNLGTTNASRGDIIFAGEIRGVSLVNPS
jgi:hypothetical protein